MNTRLRSLTAAWRPREISWWIVPAVAALALIYGLATVTYPPWGGLAGLLLALAVVSAVWLLLHRVGLFLIVFITFGTFAPFLSRIVHFPLGLFKGSFFLLVLPLWLLSRVAREERGAWWQSVRIPLLAYGFSALLLSLLGIVSILRGVDALLVLDALKGFLLYPPLIFLAAEGAGHLRTERRAFHWILFLCALAAAGAVAQALLGFELMGRLGLNLETGALPYVAVDPLSGRFYQRVFSILDDQVALAAFSMTGVALSTALMQIERRPGLRILYVLVLALNAYALILTFNVTVVVGTVLFVLILVWQQRSPRLLATFLVAVLVVVGLSWIHLGPMIRNRLITSFSTEVGVSSSLLGRVEENSRAVALFQQAPIIGHGIGSTANLGLYYRMGLAETIGTGIATDNHYMTVILESGLVGLAAVLLLYLLPLWGLMRLGRSPDPATRTWARVGGVWAFILILMNASNSPVNTNPTNLLFWCLGGLAWRRSCSGTDEETSMPGPVGVKAGALERRS